MMLGRSQSAQSLSCRAPLARQSPASASWVLPVRLGVFADLHRPRNRIDAQVVMRDLRHLVPVEPGWVAYGLLESRGRLAMSDDVEPVTITAVLSNAPLVRREQDRAG